MFRNNLLNNIYKYMNTKSMQNVIKEFSKEEVIDSINSIYYSSGYICTNSNNRILRLIEFGGPGVKPLCLLTLSGIGIGGSYGQTI